MNPVEARIKKNNNKENLQNVGNAQNLVGKKASKKRRQRRRHHHVHQVMKNEPQLAIANDPIETCVNAILTMPATFKIADISMGGEDYTAKTPGHLVQNFTLKLTPKECYQAVDGAGVLLGGNSVDAVILRQYTLEVKVISDLHLQEVNRVLVIGGLLVLVGLPTQLMRNSAAGSAAFSWLGERLGFKLIDVGSRLERFCCLKLIKVKSAPSRLKRPAAPAALPPPARGAGGNKKIKKIITK